MNFNLKSSNRTLAHSVAKHSNWKPEFITHSLKENGVYASRKEWKTFIYYALLSLGLAFTVSGIIFFLAFNWADLHKFVKLGLVQGAIIVFIAAAIFSKASITVKNIFLMAASITVGALFAVFGQIYQTGANAYDFFLGWTVFISIWALISRFPPLWLSLIVLINTTFLLYTDQVSKAFSDEEIYTILFAFNSLIVLCSEWLFSVRKIHEMPRWYIQTIALAAFAFGTLTISTSIHGHFFPYGLISCLIAAPLYYLAVKDSLQNKNIFYLCCVPLSIIIILSSLLVKISYDEGMMLIITLFVIGSISFQINQIITISKKWNGK